MSKVIEKYVDEEIIKLKNLLLPKAIDLYHYILGELINIGKGNQSHNNAWIDLLNIDPDFNEHEGAYVVSNALCRVATVLEGRNTIVKDNLEALKSEYGDEDYLFNLKMDIVKQIELYNNDEQEVL